MDPDQAADAGVHHDDIADSADDSADGCCDGGSDDSWPRALLRRGWDLSRKAAIAGVAATAAPVVVPPLLVLSVCGIALSLPFAAYLASLAATDHLMAALLPPPRAQSYHTCDLDEDDEFLDDAAVDNWGKRGDGAASLPLLPESRLSERPVPASGDEEDTMAEGEFLFQELGRHEPFVFDNGEQKEQGTTNEDYEYISATEALLRDEDNMIERLVEAPVTALESIQQSSVPESGDKADDWKRPARKKDMEPSDQMLSAGVDITELSDFQVPALGNRDIVVQREVEGENPYRKFGHDSREPDIGGKAEEIPLQEVDVSESFAPDNSTPQRKTEDDVTVEMVVEEVTMNTPPVVTGEVADDQLDSIATTMPESGSLQTSDLVAHELQEAAYVHDIIETTSTEDIEPDIGDTNIEGVERQCVGGVSGVVTNDIGRDIGDTDTGDMEHNGEGGVSIVASLVVLDDAMDLVSSRTRSTPVSGITDDMTSVVSRPDDRFNQTTCCPTTNKKLREKEIAEEKHVETEENKTMDMVHTSSMEQQNTDVSKSPVPDNQSKIEDEVTVLMVPADMTNDTDDLATGKMVAVQWNVVASESELLPPSDRMAQELQAVNKAVMVDQIEGSTKMEDIIKDISKTNTKGGEHHSDVSGPSEVTVGGKDLILGRQASHARGRGGATSDKGMPDVDHPHQRNGAEYELLKEISERNVVAEDTDYTEEQLREQLDTLRTIAGYRSPLSLTLEAELDGLYIFVGVEPPVSSRDASELNELNAKLRFLKSIIGVE